MILDKIEKNREDYLNGKLKCIPFNLDRLNKIVPGIIKGSLDCITANSSVGKTQITKKLYVYDAIKFAIDNNIDLKILYFGLEESEDEFDYALLSYLVHTNLRIRSNITDFSSFIDAYPQEYINQIKESNVPELFKQYKSYVTFYESVYNSWGIYLTIRNFAKSRGKFYQGNTLLSDDAFANSQNPAYSKYVPNNPDEFVICIIDHVSELVLQKDEPKLKDAIDNLVRHMRLYVTKLIKYNVLCVHQQDSSQESVDNKKENYMKPKLQGLGDSKTVGRAYVNIFGLFDPKRYNMATYKSYDLNRLDRNFRVLNIIKQRYGSVGEEVPLFFDGKVTHIKTLPKADDYENMDKVYSHINSLT